MTTTFTARDELRNINDEKRFDKDDEDIDELQEDRRVFPFEMQIRKEGSRMCLKFYCEAYGEDAAILRVACASPFDVDSSRYDDLPIEKLGEKVAETATDYLINRGLDTEMLQDIVDYRIRDDAEEFQSWLKRVSKFLQA
eukprot:CAMPEP_0170187170 /NCGR_PEP_ID=MMETSP0040_2-20121228/41104_1 /TAXON_ID=641309 /ORGANISM="Lotharella oceanica, Strain CCMP622" /LENGTH=139 /DNA_ID=CAMNT_0010434147 /DNA_START=248 /DNA_END=667 /DNA_ORIENTATION=+